MREKERKREVRLRGFFLTLSSFFAPLSFPLSFLPSCSLASKKPIKSNQLDGLAERMRIFVTRMRLSGDAQAKEWLHLVRGEEVV